MQEYPSLDDYKNFQNPTQLRAIHSYPSIFCISFFCISLHFQKPFRHGAKVTVPPENMRQCQASSQRRKQTKKNSRANGDCGSLSYASPTGGLCKFQCLIWVFTHPSSSNPLSTYQEVFNSLTHNRHRVCCRLKL